MKKTVFLLGKIQKKWKKRAEKRGKKTKKLTTR